jgi:hypothetical protein
VEPDRLILPGRRTRHGHVGGDDLVGRNHNHSEP